MILKPFQAIIPNLGLISSADAFFNTVKNQYTEYLHNGFFKRSAQEAIYVYRLKSSEGIHKGIMTSTDVEDFSNGRVLKHENTLAAKEQQMMNLLLQNHAMVKPVLLAYDHVKDIDDFIDKVIVEDEPFFEIEFQQAHQVHTIWEINDGERLSVLFDLFRKKVKKSYIADGHHRVSTMVNLHKTQEESGVLENPLTGIFSIYFSWKELSVYDYNRCIEAFQLISPIKFMAFLTRYFKIKPLKHGRKPRSKHELTMNMYGEWYRLKWKNSILKKHEKDSVIFDADLLNEYVLQGILGIKNIREDSRITYLSGIEGSTGMEDAVAKSQNNVGFCLYPIPYEDIKKVSEEGKVMPPKSTWFEPRVKNGLVTMEFS